MKSVFTALWCFCFMLIAVIGCEQNMNMMKPVVQDVMSPGSDDKSDVPNIAPIFTDGDETTRSIAENTTSGENLGDTISATDADSGDTLTYSLGGTDAASFTIDSATGQLQTEAALDYETKSSYSVTVTVSDGMDTDIIDVVINITDLSEDVTDLPEVEGVIYNVGDIISSLPAGPGLLRGSFYSEGGWSQTIFAQSRILIIDNGTKLTYSGYTYTCLGEGDCQIHNNEVTAGTIERTSADD